MKFIAQLLMIMAMSATMEAFNLEMLDAGSSQLTNDLLHLVDLLPMDDIIRLLRAYSLRDQEFQLSMHILNMRSVGLFTEDTKVAQEEAALLNFMEVAGIDIHYLVEKLNVRVDAVYTQEPFESEIPITGGLAGLAKDIQKLIPSETANTLIQRKQAIYDTFVLQYNKTMNEEFEKFNFFARMEDHFDTAVKIAKKLGLDDRLFKQFLPVFLLVRALGD